jgi:K+-transporting ATPase c subunit
MMIDNNFDFGIAIDNNTPEDDNFAMDQAEISTRVHNAGSAKILFGNVSNGRIFYQTAVSANVDAVLIEFLAASDSGLTADVISLGAATVYSDYLGVALPAATTIRGSFEIGQQHSARQYYGLRVTQKGATSGISAGEGLMVLEAQSNLAYARAAAPA